MTKKWILIINLLAIGATLVGLLFGYYFFLLLIIPLGFNLFNKNKHDE
jgi:hypothetical protein